MTRLIPLLVSSVLIGSAVPALANPTQYGDALKQAAIAGQLTPRGVWDAK
jgi:hypothetical protein